MLGENWVTAVLAGAGRSERMGRDKLLLDLNGVAVAIKSIQAMAQSPYVDDLVFVAGENHDAIRGLLAENPPPKPCCLVLGGNTRQQSVQIGVAQAQRADIVAIHDAARPFASVDLINTVIEAAALHGAAAPAIPVKDTIKVAGPGGTVAATPDRSALRAVQTPQVFKKKLYLQALAGLENEDVDALTDDCTVLERAGLPVYLTKGDEANLKITTRQDLERGSGQMPRMGHGYDVHRLVEGRPLVLGGVQVPFEKGLLGHSDADVLAHVVMDALLGALALGDIGKLFPDTAPEYKGADSMQLLREVQVRVRAAGYTVANLDATLLCQRPKLAEYIDDMRNNIARVLLVAKQQVSVKATTEEGLGFTGAGEGIAAHCVVLLEKI